ncbi:uncharacterized protein F5147DRAFT_395342 [Suillus discolor]|uniref:F-box domain-containing protein n=1 Tax=Suillus discolor TaxID=1912936 RepID=A0A9P7EYK8_9AGAM|nr:uncharacterized protein F5147DRAFT_395342 [Suillus discolor]KAG2095874.1 hypothetical protein F5147DRAFT_395342 [Suillus discolor]
MNYQIHRPCHINVLPVEILSYIFTLATHHTASTDIDHKGRYEVPFSPESVTMPTVLASVHRHWRHIALSTSTLWSSLSMSLEQVVRCKVGSDADAYTTFLDVQRLAAHIARSRNSPVDILIDTRDPEWDFEEEEECSPHNATFFQYATFIPQILDLLFPQMYRWRSLTILSDTWAPLRVALERLSVPTLIKGLGAPHLETLILMRCNEFLGHSDVFSPRTQHVFDGIPFAALTGAPHHDLSVQSHPLPKLRNLTLVGVHLNWTHLSRYTLGVALNEPLSYVSSCIQSLELSQHCREVRPTVDEFTGILKACPLLRKLVIRVSGPKFDAGVQRSDRPVSLPLLEDIHLGYTNVEDAAMLLSHIHAPNLISISIEDANHIASPDIEDSGPLLTYLATGFLDLCDISTEAGLNHGVCTSYLATSNDSVKTPFPHLERLSLNGVAACLTPFSLLMAVIPKLRHLSLSRTPSALLALLPIQTPFADVSTRTIPCRALESIEIFCIEEPTKNLLEFVQREREQSGAPRVCNIDIHLEVSSADTGEENEGYQIIEDDMVENQTGYGEWVPDEQDPFAPGGAFNDPDFDEAYHYLS